MNIQETTFQGAPAQRYAGASAGERGLVADAKRGASSAFGELYERHRARIYRCAFRILANREDAEDAVQRAFQHAFINLDGFREDSTFSTWLTRIAINEALMLLRQRRATTHLFEIFNDDIRPMSALDFADDRPTPEQTLADIELQTALKDAISRLRGTLQSVVVLRELQELTSAETAERLGLSVAAVKARIFHARRHLRRHLRPNCRVRDGLKGGRS